MTKKKGIETLAQMGGRAVVEKYGVDHMKKIAKRGRRARDKKYGRDFYKELSRKGVEARRLKKEAKIKEKNSPFNRVTRLLTGTA